MANWEVNKTKRYNKPIEEHDAKIRGQAFRIEASEGSDKGVLYLWNDLRGYERIAYGAIADLKRQAEGMGKREARGVAAIERRANYSRPGAKDMMASHKEGFQKEYILWALPKGETDRLHERPIAEGITTPQQMDDAKRKAAAQGWHGFRVQILDMSKPFRWMSRLGVKDTMAVEDRFYFGKERFAQSLQAKWDGKQYRVLTPNGAAWYSDDGKSWTLKHGEPVPASELRKYDIKVGTGFSRPGAKETMAVDNRFYFGKGRKDRFAASDKVDSLIATAYRALRNGDKAAARRLIASAEALVQSDSSVPDYIVNELKDLKKSLRF